MSLKTSVRLMSDVFVDFSIEQFISAPRDLLQREAGKDCRLSLPHTIIGSNKLTRSAHIIDPEGGCGGKLFTRAQPAILSWPSSLRG